MNGVAPSARVDSIRRSLVSLKMPRALEILDEVVELALAEDNPLHRPPAHRARLPIPPVHRKILAKRRDLPRPRELPRPRPIQPKLPHQARGPRLQHAAAGPAQPHHLLVSQPIRALERAHPRRVQNLIRIRVTNAVARARISQRPLQRPSRPSQRGGELHLTRFTEEDLKLAEPLIEQAKAQKTLTAEQLAIIDEQLKTVREALKLDHKSST